MNCTDYNRGKQKDNQQNACRDPHRISSIHGHKGIKIYLNIRVKNARLTPELFSVIHLFCVLKQVRVLIFYEKRELLHPSEILYTAKFAEEFVTLIHQQEEQCLNNLLKGNSPIFTQTLLP
ncbi:MAG: hypothetical protein U5K54_19180 [Cytophagales bacterium]|nr:hypothetical protein [Cytophagales bacterium]